MKKPELEHEILDEAMMDAYGWPRDVSDHVICAVSWSDGGGKVQTNLKPLRGRQAVARFWSFWLSLERQNQRPLTLTLAEINGSPAILFWEKGSLAIVISLAVSAVGIQEIFALLNPEKLAYLQKQLSSSRRLSSVES